MATPASPALTIVIPTYNRLEALGRLLACLCNQVDQLVPGEVEICISDNGQNVNDCMELEQLVTKPYVSLNVQKTNVGFDKNCMDGFLMASGRYVWFIGDDDLPHRSAVENVLQLIRSHCPIALILNCQIVMNLDKIPERLSEETRYKTFSADLNGFPPPVARKLGFLSGHVLATQAARNVLERLGHNHFAGTEFFHVALFLECCRNNPTRTVLYVESPLLFSEPDQRRTSASWVESRLFTDLNGYTRLFSRYCNSETGATLFRANAMHVLRDMYQLVIVSAQGVSWSTYRTVVAEFRKSGLPWHSMAATTLLLSPRWIVFAARALKHVLFRRDN